MDKFYFPLAVAFYTTFLLGLLSWLGKFYIERLIKGNNFELERITRKEAIEMVEEAVKELDEKIDQLNQKLNNLNEEIIHIKLSLVKLETYLEKNNTLNRKLNQI